MKSSVKGRQPASIRSPSESDRGWILELLDGAKERQESAFPGINGDELLYFAHLSAVRQLTEIYYRRVLKPFQVSYSEYRVLSSLRVRGKEFRTTPLDLNRYAQITSAGMTRTLDRLEEARYVDRSPNPEDRRSILVGLTDEGWTFSETLGRALSEHYSDALAGISSKQLKAETDCLRAAVDRLASAVID